MIHLVEGAKRQKTPNEIALSILLAGFTIIFLMVCITLLPFSLFSTAGCRSGYTDHNPHPGGAARLPHPDHNRGPAFCDRDRRNGPVDPAECDCHVWTGS